MELNALPAFREVSAGGWGTSNTPTTTRTPVVQTEGTIERPCPSPEHGRTVRLSRAMQVRQFCVRAVSELDSESLVIVMSFDVYRF